MITKSTITLPETIYGGELDAVTGWGARIGDIGNWTALRVAHSGILMCLMRYNNSI